MTIKLADKFIVFITSIRGREEQSWGSFAASDKAVEQSPGEEGAGAEVADLPLINLSSIRTGNSSGCFCKLPLKRLLCVPVEDKATYAASGGEFRA